MLTPGESLDAAQNLSDLLKAAVEVDLVLYGPCIDSNVTFDGTRDAWPVAIVRLRRAALVSAEQAAAREADEALREGGVEGLERWAEAAKRRDSES